MTEYYTTIGMLFCGIGGVMLFLYIIFSLGSSVCSAWMRLSNKFRRICQAESLIYEYKKNRDEFMAWKNRKKGGKEDGE